MWIKHISYQNAKGRLRKLYDRVKGPDNNVDNIMLAHSLRPHSMEGHMALYKNVLHHSGNTIDKWFLEALGVYTSMLNHCDYCVEHHFAGMARLIDDDEKSQRIRIVFSSKSFKSVFSNQQTTALHYADKLTRVPHLVCEEDLALLKTVGWEDAEILEINQVVAYFNYANRTVLGLGVYTQDDIIGLSPNNSDDPDNWRHQ